MKGNYYALSQNASSLHQQGPNSKLYKALISPCLTLLSPLPSSLLGTCPVGSMAYSTLVFTKEGKNPEGGALQSEVKMAASLRATRAWGWYS